MKNDIELKNQTRSSDHGDFMIWWSKQNNAVRYVINLYIEGKKVAEIEKPRNIRYHSFIGMANLNYKVSVIAEDNEGNVLSSASIERKQFIPYHYACNDR